MNVRLASPIAFMLLFEMVSVLFTACGNNQRPNPPALTLDQQYLIKGRQLSEKYCRSCHLYPGPELLDKQSWGKVLPVMEAEMTKQGLSISSFEWIALQDYYQKAAPATIVPPGPEELREATTQFQEGTPILPASATPPSVTLVKYDPQTQLLYTGDAEGNVSLFKNTTLVKTLHTDNIPIDIHPHANDKSLDILGIGSLFPSGLQQGNLIRVDAVGHQTVLIDSLRRPVHFISQDFDSDGQEEYLISCFGSISAIANTGNLSLFTLKGGHYQEHLIKAMPGATKTVTGDFNHDNRPDFIALFSQGKESISLFLNKGNLEFEEKTLLEFLPVYGSNSFELADMNGDSFPDIVFTNGDNDDYSLAYKSYHGVRIFMNNGRNEFKEGFFFHINGASKVLVRDFDSDHDPDLVVLAMYPNLTDRPQEALVYFQNQGGLHFEPFYVEKEPSGKWIVMDAGDLDQDGDEDVVVGSNLKLNLPLPAYYEQKWNQHKESYRIFRNNSPKNQEESAWKKFWNALF